MLLEELRPPVELLLEQAGHQLVDEVLQRPVMAVRWQRVAGVNQRWSSVSGQNGFRMKIESNLTKFKVSLEMRVILLAAHDAEAVRTDLAALQMLHDARPADLAKADKIG